MIACCFYNANNIINHDDDNDNCHGAKSDNGDDDYIDSIIKNGNHY